MSTGGLPPLRITDVKTICTAPHGARLAVVTAVEQYLRPFLIGKDPDNSEDIFQSVYVSSYSGQRT